MDRERFPIDTWRLVEARLGDDGGLVGTLFAIGNGYLGLRADWAPDPQSAGSYVNGFHETFPIVYPETAHALAKTGQSILNAPDAKSMELAVAGEPLLLAAQPDRAEISDFHREIDFRTGVLTSRFTWHPRGGGRVGVVSERLVSLTRRHLAALRLSVTVLEQPRPVTLRSLLVNRQDVGCRRPAPPVPTPAVAAPSTIVCSSRSCSRTTMPRPQVASSRSASGARQARCASRSQDAPHRRWRHGHVRERDRTRHCEHDDRGGARRRRDRRIHEVRRLLRRRSDRRCLRSGDRRRARGAGAGDDRRRPRLRLERTRRRAGDMARRVLGRTDIAIEGDDAAQQAIRWNLFQMAQASANVGERGIAAKAVTAGGYDGHYFWDTEVYVVPMLAYNNPDAARDLLRFRHRTLPTARRRAVEMANAARSTPGGRSTARRRRRTIRPARRSTTSTPTSPTRSTATSRQPATSSSSPRGRRDAGRDRPVLRRRRLLRQRRSAELPHPRRHRPGRVHRRRRRQRLHERDGAVHAALRGQHGQHARLTSPRRPAAAGRRNRPGRGRGRGVDAGRGRDVRAVRLGARHQSPGRHVPRARAVGLGRHAAREVPAAPELPPARDLPPPGAQAGRRRARHFMRSEDFPADLQRRNFDYYDPITTGDSSLSACVQAIMAAEVGHADLARQYFDESLYLDIADTHGNTVDGAHIANVGGVWAGLVHGFAGVRDTGGHVRVRPRLPAGWNSMRFKLQRRGSDIGIALDPGSRSINWAR